MSDPDRLKRVDALLEGLDDVLPPPRVRSQLRLAANLTQQEIADAVGVKRLAVVRWELGKSTPRRPQRQAYIHLLKRLAERFPEAAELHEDMPTPASGSGGLG
ncbi:helix-turn-helix transcriptional regulator [Streptomyces antarcticus]|uniref:helix-turn-helix transcriptional regulator n=1 Tax=Streptomyces antarcticus TaxID=2996458 RepID=UPI00226FB92D|nr:MULTISPECIES: helix-turn-helix transcriptional regulator [unclassified Streptomyces]MCY0946980.1 helix-turn-helix transcriptional regulator [Streptomyces sp. H34-AA3]MCZ4088422.1 helix-turn-helix transcriptional regulator [Streptomyces sp. H34-S5]